MPFIFILLLAYCGTVGIVEALETGIGSILRPVSSPFRFYPDLKKKHGGSVPRTSNSSPGLVMMSDDRTQVSGSFIEKGLKWLLRRDVGKGGGVLGVGDEGNFKGIIPAPLKSVVEVAEADPVSGISSSALPRRKLLLLLFRDRMREEGRMYCCFE